LLGEDWSDVRVRALGWQGREPRRAVLRALRLLLLMRPHALIDWDISDQFDGLSILVDERRDGGVYVTPR
jgi:hypothetical protein